MLHDKNDKTNEIDFRLLNQGYYRLYETIFQGISRAPPGCFRGKSRALQAFQISEKKVERRRRKENFWQLEIDKLAFHSMR